MLDFVSLGNLISLLIIFKFDRSISHLVHVKKDFQTAYVGKKQKDSVMITDH